jgi:3-oxoacyl-[acyl-carrier protein] reductase
MPSDLRDKVALVTGASTGIGAAVARRLAQLGAKVAAHYNNSADAVQALVRDITRDGGTAAAIRGDVTDSGEVRRIVAETIDAFGRIDILVNNAGGLVRRALIEQYDDDYLDDVLALNSKQIAWFMREVVPIMRKQGGGNVINVSSISARTGGGGASVVYGGAKAFAATVTRGWARELASDNIRVNAVSPGVIATPFHERFSTSERLAAMTKSIPLGRIGTADECAGTFVYLASDEMSGYVTGQVIEVNGGQYMA